MYECPSCAENLRYHIKKKMLYCDHCETTMDPYAFQKGQDAEERTDYDVAIFSCPQCGGTLRRRRSRRWLLRQWRRT